MTTLIRLLCLLAMLLALSACNTIKGMGEDIEAAGEKIEREAGSNKTY
ncbi:MAG: entericidin A/B family lipoprotein [Candidatus Competibacterales bacterium]|nr:entericidin A/B family lipoprotein [Candidatus Competibacterales bacterium]